MPSASPVQILQSSEASVRLRAAQEWLTSRVDRGARVVSASRGAADDLVRAVAAVCGAAAGVHRFSFEQLAAPLRAPILAGRGGAPATVVGVGAVAARAAVDARQDHELPYFDNVAGTPGFPRALA